MPQKFKQPKEAQQYFIVTKAKPLRIGEYKIELEDIGKKCVYLNLYRNGELIKDITLRTSGLLSSDIFTDATRDGEVTHLSIAVKDVLNNRKGVKLEVTWTSIFNMMAGPSESEIIKRLREKKEQPEITVKLGPGATVSIKFLSYNEKSKKFTIKVKADSKELTHLIGTHFFSSQSINRDIKTNKYTIEVLSVSPGKKGTYVYMEAKSK